MANIPEEITVNILSYLPVKSLLRFRCVSKSWCTLISDPGFAKSHLKRRYEKHNANYTDHHTILTSWSSEFRSMNYDASIGSYQENNLHAGFLPIGSMRYEALGSCNGLIYLFRNTNHQIIWNPSTRDYKVLSKPLNLPLSYFCGFGYDHSINDYKVVVGYILDCVSTCTIFAEVLTLKTNTWKANYWKWVQGVGNLFTLSNGAIPLNGVLHWQQLHDGGEFIMSFDLATEKFMELTQLPPSAKKISLFPKDLGVLQDCLCLCRTSIDENIEEVWVMKEYGVSSSWSKLFNVLIEPDAYHFKHHYMPLCILINGDVVMESNGSKLVIYSPENKTFRCIREARAEGFHKLKSVLYVETLVLVN